MPHIEESNSIFIILKKTIQSTKLTWITPFIALQLSEKIFINILSLAIPNPCHLSIIVCRLSMESEFSTADLLIFSLQNVEDSVMRAAIVDILCIVVEYNPSLVREYLLKESNSLDEVFLEFAFIVLRFTII